ncbi:DHA2 family efflux MFS transporter permease subunit [Kaistia defluvii]|uniref:DHA2 family efflux MFS transporter permease subunit n=1 Tax=Kaistia defluvii TaxID=410841 RepID=UPI00224D9B20|nr:DHA2 family efflux MFS transporter permease subunit [Kaistia defluvii]MCX5521244.1 DHA2 family efflux MFS transporter permease subunit [Kaistia defluvii]
MDEPVERKQGMLPGMPQPIASFRDRLARRPAYPWYIVGVTCIGSFMGQFDASVVQLALPHLAEVFQLRETVTSWVALAYLLSFSVSLPVFGWLCQQYGRKPLYLFGMATFLIASLLCSIATSLPQLIAFRVLQGLGAGLLGANSVSILVRAAGKERRGRAMGIFSAAQAVGVSLGPIVGGLLIGSLGWRSIFWVTPPIGVIGLLLGWLILPHDDEKGAGRFDWRGALLLPPALLCIVLALSQAADWGIASAAFIGTSATGIVLLALFILFERRTDSPLVDLKLFKSEAFSLGILAVLFSYAMLYGMFYLVSFALVRGFHDAPELAGLRLAAIPIALGVAAPIAGSYVNRLGVTALTLAGMALCAAALLALSLVALEPSPSRLFGILALAAFGAGLGMFIAPNNSATMGAAPPALSGEAGAMFNLARMLGVSLGVASAASMLAWRMKVIDDARTDDVAFYGHPILGAVETSFLLLFLFALVATIATLKRRRLRGEDSAAAPERAGKA